MSSPRTAPRATPIPALVFAHLILAVSVVYADFSPVRLARNEWLRREVEKAPPYNVPLNDGWSVEGTNPAELGSVCVLPAGIASAQLARDVALDADTLNTFSITMSISDGVTAVLSWQNEAMSDYDPQASLTFAVRPDSGVHSYTQSFSPEKNPMWTGHIKCIRLRFPTKPANINIHGMQFAFVSAGVPPRVTLDNETHEVLPGTESTQRISMPPNPVFECWLGARGSPGAQGVRFTAAISADPADASSTETIDLTPATSLHRWQHVIRPLPALSGKNVVITLTSEPRGAGFWGSPMVFNKRDEPAKGPVILISCDTARPDHFSCYGYSRPTTPFLDEFKKDSVLFEQAITTSTWTLPSHISMLTGLTEKTHGVSLFTTLPESVITLPEALTEAGFVTAAFTGMSANLRPSAGFAQGFDLYNVPQDGERTFFDTAALVKEWLTQHSPHEMFLFFHNFDLHSSPGMTALKNSPYGPRDERYLFFAKDVIESGFPPDELKRWFSGTDTQEVFRKPIDPKALAYGLAGYDDAIRSVDDGIEDLISLLRQMGLYDSAMIIVTSDHGEEFGEHGRYGHHTAHEECCRVPLLIKFPDNLFAGHVVSDMVRLVDIFPTIAEAVKMPPLTNLDGRSLIPLLNGAHNPESLTADIIGTTQMAVRTPSAKMLLNMPDLKPEYYQLTVDPGETNDLVQEHPNANACVRKSFSNILINTGWVISLYPGQTTWAANLTFQLPEGIASLSEIHGMETLDFERDQTSELPMSSRGISTALKISCPYRVFIRPVEGENPLVLSLSSAEEFEVILDTEKPWYTNRFESVMDTHSRQYNRPVPMPNRIRERPALIVWYGSYDSARPQADELSPEQIEQLQSLGYLK